MSSGSMSVHSLIDKFSGKPPPHDSRQQPRQEPSSSAQDSPTITSPSKRTASEIDITSPPLQAHSHASTISDPGLLALLGPNVTTFPFSESAYVESIKLRTEQEKTKQDFYKLEIAGKNLHIIQLALSAQIPTHLIPNMCVGPGFPPGADVESQITNQLRQLQQQQQQKQQQQKSQPEQQHQPPHPNRRTPTPMAPPAQQQQQQQRYLTTPTQLTSQESRPLRASPAFPPASSSSSHFASPQQQAFQPSHSRSSSSRDLSHPDSLSANPIPPMQFKFGSGSPSHPSWLHNRRPLSPAKIGAAAVANLSTPTGGYRARQSIPAHQRHFSMPVESSASAKSSPQQTTPLPPTGAQRKGTDLSRINTQFQVSPQRDTSQPSSSTRLKPSTSSSGHLQSPQGATSSIQVKPLPAQPLHKQSKSNQLPSQESMTSFQHIIQFHHWKPENPGQGPGQGQPPASSTSTSHKRHKSETGMSRTPSISSSSRYVDTPHVYNQPAPSFTPPAAASLQRGPIISVSEPESEQRHQLAPPATHPPKSAEDQQSNDDNDITMDTSNTSVTDLSPNAKNTPRGEGHSLGPNSVSAGDRGPGNTNQKVHSQTSDSGKNESTPQSQTAGRFPHDILSPSNS